MLYFAYGSNLNHRQMKHRCSGSKFIKKFTLKGYKLIFSHSNPKNKYGHAHVQNKFIKRKPTSRYLHTIIEGYKDCKLDLSFLRKRITFYTLNYKIIW